MIGEEIADLSLKVVREMRLRDGERIVLAGPIDYKWRHMSSINHNVFRLDMSGNIIWQVRRKEILFADWGKPDKTPVIIDPAFATEDCDSFASMGTHFSCDAPLITINHIFQSSTTSILRTMRLDAFLR